MKKVIVFLIVGLIFGLFLSGNVVAKELTTADGYTVSVDPVQSQYAYDGNGNLEYIGRAVPGAATSAAKWQIQKFVYDESGNLAGSYYADDDLGFSKVWDDRETYDYE